MVGRLGIDFSPLLLDAFGLSTRMLFVSLWMGRFNHRDAPSRPKGNTGATFRLRYNSNRTSNLGDLKYVQIHDLDDGFNNSRVHCTYDLRLQIKQRGSFVSGFK